VAQSAIRSAALFATADSAHYELTKGLFCWFFDLHTHNGGLKGLDQEDVQKFVKLEGSATADDIVCDWLGSRPNAMTGARDGRNNLDLWRNAVPPDRLSLNVLSYLRAPVARYAPRAHVLNRKGAIALGVGWVHREKHDLRSLTGFKG
jgi:hypothetical protein